MKVLKNGAVAGGAFDWVTPFVAACGLGLVAGYALLGAPLAYHEDGRKDGGSREAYGQGAAGRCTCLHGDRQPVDPARLRPHRGAMVLATEYFVFLVGPRRDRARRIRGMALDRERARGAAVPRNHRSFPVGLSRTFDFEFPLYRSTVADDLAGGRGARNPCLHADGHVSELPIIFGYTIFVYWIFRGKLREGEGYH